MDISRFRASAAVDPVPALCARDATPLRTGIVGSVIATLFTPVLVVLLGAVGLLAVMGWLGAVLPPVLLVFLDITAYALWRRRRTA